MLFVHRPLQRLLLGVTIVAALAGRVSAELKVGDPAPEFQLRDVYDHWHRLSQLRGQVVLIGLWGYS